MKSPRILFCGGGSVGHLAPSVAVLERIRETHPDTIYFFLCARSARDEAYLRSEELPFSAIPYLRLSLKLPLHLLQSIVTVRKMFREFRPTVIFCNGGSIGIVPALLAKLSNIPVLLHESDAVMGRANTFISRFATTVCLGFPASGSPNSKFQIPNSNRFVYTGNPIRERITKGDRHEGLRITGFSGNRPVLLVWGGSQGAQALNDIVAEHINALTDMFDVVHITGEGKKAATLRGPAYRQAGSAYTAMPFAGRELAHIFAITTLAVSRAGAGSIAELSACGIPMILVPLRGVAQDHQKHNADAIARSGGCIVRGQEELHRELPALVGSLLTDEKKLKDMKASLAALAPQESVRHIADLVLHISRKAGAPGNGHARVQD